MTQSVVIVTMNRVEEVLSLLRALGAQTRQADEILIVDASSDGLRVSEDRIRHVTKAVSRRFHVAPGLAAQRNKGLSEARGDIVTFFDDDAIPEADYCHHVDAAFEREQDLVGLSGINVVPEGATGLEYLFRRGFMLQSGRGPYRYRCSGFPDPGADGPSQTGGISFLPSTALSVRRSACEGLSFDEYWCSGKPLGIDTGRCFGEDIWFTTLLAKRGRLKLLPAAKFMHHPSARNREATAVTQALYVYSLRCISNRVAAGKIRRLCRLWALCGQGLLNLFQALGYRDVGYLQGYFLAMRASLERREPSAAHD